MKIRNLILLFIALASASAAVAQSFSIYAETGLLLNSAGSAVEYNVPDLNGRVINGYFGIVDETFTYGGVDPLNPSAGDLNAILGQITWTAMVDASTLDPVNLLFMTPNAPSLEPIELDKKPVVLFTDAPNPDSISAPAQIALAEGAPFKTILDNRAMSLGSGTLTIIVGTGALQLVDVSGGTANTWGGFAIESRDGGEYVDTGDWLGELEVSLRPWTWSTGISEWFVIDEQVAADGKGWVYVPSLDNLLLNLIPDEDWGYSHSLEAWLYVPADTLTAGAGWVYAM